MVMDRGREDPNFRLFHRRHKSTNCLSVFDHFVKLTLKGLKSRLSVEGVWLYNNGLFLKSYCNLHSDSIKQILKNRSTIF